MNRGRGRGRTIPLFGTAASRGTDAGFAEVEGPTWTTAVETAIIAAARTLGLGDLEAGAVGAAGFSATGPPPTTNACLQRLQRSRLPMRASGPFSVQPQPGQAMGIGMVLSPVECGSRTASKAYRAGLFPLSRGQADCGMLAGRGKTGEPLRGMGSNACTSSTRTSRKCSRTSQPLPKRIDCAQVGG